MKNNIKMDNSQVKYEAVSWIELSQYSAK